MRIIVVEDDADYAEIIADSLRFDAHEVVVAEGAESALRLATRTEPDLAIVDVMLPDGSGLDVAQTLTSEEPAVPVIMLSSLDRSQDVVAGFAHGADDYIRKPFHPSELIARVRAAARRKALGTSGAGSGMRQIQGRGLELDVERQLAYSEGAELGCTQLEFQILLELTRAPGQVLTYAYLNERVWHYTHMRDGSLLKGHISSLRRKLREAGGDPSTIRTVQGVGYSLVA
jgi:DNA-binding response OmpR family regulator